MNIKRLTEIGCYRVCGIARPACAWPADQDQRPHPEGPEETIANKKK